MKSPALTCCELQYIIMIVEAMEICFAHVNIVIALAEVKIYNIDRIDLANFVISLSKADVLGDGFGDAIGHAMEIIQFTVVLYFEQHKYATVILGEEVDTVKFVVGSLLIPFAFQYVFYMNFAAKNDSKQTFKHYVVGFVAQDAFDGPVKPNKIIFHKL